jgi:hypothetical protein
MALETVNHKNRKFKVVSTESIDNFQNLKAEQPNIDYFFVAEGKKGALISGFVTKQGKIFID